MLRRSALRRRARFRGAAAAALVALLAAAWSLLRPPVVPPAAPRAEPQPAADAPPRPPPPPLPPVQAFLAARLGPPAGDDLAALTKWLAARTNGTARLRGALPASFPPAGLRGLASAHPARPGDVLLSLPLSATLSVATFSGAAGLRAAVAGSIEAPHLFASQVVLLHELLRCDGGAGGDWCPYLASLPRSFPELPAFFADTRPAADPAAEDARSSKRLWTRLRALAPLVTAQRQELSAVARDVFRALRRLSPDSAAVLDALPEDTVAGLGAWAWAVARTRMLDQPLSSFDFASARRNVGGLVAKVPVLMPFADMLNHEEAGAASCALVSHHSPAGGASPGSLQLVAQRRLVRGEQLTFPYVDTSREGASPDEGCDDQMLSHYGFLVGDGSPRRDCWGVRLSPTSLGRLTGLAPGAHANALRAARAAPSVAHVFTGEGVLYVGLLRWIGAATGVVDATGGAGLAEREGGTDGTAHHPADGDPRVWDLLARLLRVQAAALRRHVAAAAARGEAGGGDGEAVLRLAAGALRAADVATAAAEAGAARLAAGAELGAVYEGGASPPPAQLQQQQAGWSAAAPAQRHT